MRRVLSFLIFVPALIMGCTTENSNLQQDPNAESVTSKPNVKDEKAYTSSAIHPDFPVPKKAQKTNHRSDNPKIKYVRYSFQGLMDLKERDRYFAEIQKWGWTEEKQEQMGSMHVFKKGQDEIRISIHADFFTVFSNAE